MPTRRELANAIRALSMDAVQQANSGHPGMPMGMADIAEVLWNDFLKHNPANPTWLNRDRFVLSNGHGSMLQYALLHLTGYDLSIDDIKQFRQLHSKTPGHPEYKQTPGVETTTGPLGQGLGNAVGMAIAEAVLAALFNQASHKIIDHYTYCFVGDGCLMEGVSHEVASLAGTLGLGKLITFWDDNGISIDGPVADWFLDDTPKRFESYGWQVIANVDGHDPEAIKHAILSAQSVSDKPSLICCKTVIGLGAPNLQGTAKTHGAPLGTAEIAAARTNLAWPYPPFEIPDDITIAWDAKQKGAQLEQTWHAQYVAYQQAFPELAKELERRIRQELPVEWQEQLSVYLAEVEQKKEAIATRKASQNTLDILCDLLPELFGGSADLSESNLTFSKHSKKIGPHQFGGNYLFYGVREFGMSAIMNGMALHGGFIPYGGTFLTFLDYARNALRLSAIMGIRVIYVYTHDSIGLGEDGPTHQPIEHLSILRNTPNMSLWRPADPTETVVAWQMTILRQKGPTSLALTRQVLAYLPKTSEQIANIAKGGYTLIECEGIPDAIIIGTGSEVSLAVKAAADLQKAGYQIRVVSMPSTDVFLTQELAYRESVLPSTVKARIAVEAGSTNYWYQWVGLEGGVLGIDRYGESAPGSVVYEALGLTVETVVAEVKRVLINLQEQKKHGY
jgi:transketolase